MLIRGKLSANIEYVNCCGEFNPNTEGVPATHLSEGGADSAPPGKCSINGPNELKFYL